MRAVSVVVRNGNNILVGRRHDDQTLVLPGGGVEENETADRAAVRELLEEAGIVCRWQDLRYLGRDNNGRVVVDAYELHLDGGEPHPHYDPDHEVGEWGWLDVSSGIPHWLVSSFRYQPDIALRLAGLWPDGLTKGLREGFLAIGLAGALAYPSDSIAEGKENPLKALKVPDNLQKWRPEGLPIDMHPIAHKESSWGKSMHHTPNSRGEYHTAFGALGLKPVTAHEEYLRTAAMKQKYPNLHDAAAFVEKLKADPVFYNEMAATHFARLKKVTGSLEKAVYAWRWGIGAAARADADTVAKDPYVVDYLRLLKEGSAPLKKSASPVPMPSGETEGQRVEEASRNLRTFLQETKNAKGALAYFRQMMSAGLFPDKAKKRQLEFTLGGSVSSAANTLVREVAIARYVRQDMNDTPPTDDTPARTEEALEHGRRAEEQLHALFQLCHELSTYGDFESTGEAVDAFSRGLAGEPHRLKRELADSFLPNADAILKAVSENPKEAKRIVDWIDTQRLLPSEDYRRLLNNDILREEMGANKATSLFMIAHVDHTGKTDLTNVDRELLKKLLAEDRLRSGNILRRDHDVIEKVFAEEVEKDPEWAKPILDDFFADPESMRAESLYRNYFEGNREAQKKALHSAIADRVAIPSSSLYLIDPDLVADAMENVVKPRTGEAPDISPFVLYKYVKNHLEDTSPEDLDTSPGSPISRLIPYLDINDTIKSLRRFSGDHLETAVRHITENSDPVDDDLDPLFSEASNYRSISPKMANRLSDRIAESRRESGMLNANGLAHLHALVPIADDPEAAANNYVQTLESYMQLPWHRGQQIPIASDSETAIAAHDQAVEDPTDGPHLRRVEEAMMRAQKDSSSRSDSIVYVPQEFLQALRRRDPDASSKEHVLISRWGSKKFGLGALRKLRDHIEARGGSMSKKEIIGLLGNVPEPITKAGLLGPKGELVSSKIQAYIDNLPKIRYNVSHDEWRGPQRHNGEPSKVFRIDISTEITKKLKQAGLWNLFSKISARSASGHPAAENQTAGWVRWTENEGKESPTIRSRYENSVPSEYVTDSRLREADREELRKQFGAHDQRTLLDMLRDEYGQKLEEYIRANAPKEALDEDGFSDRTPKESTQNYVHQLATAVSRKTLNSDWTRSSPSFPDSHYTDYARWEVDDMVPSVGKWLEEQPQIHAPFFHSLAKSGAERVKKFTEIATHMQDTRQERAYALTVAAREKHWAAHEQEQKEWREKVFGDSPPRKSVFMDEMQSDFWGALRTAEAYIHRDAKDRRLQKGTQEYENFVGPRIERLRSEFPPEQMDKMNEILYHGMHPSDVLHEAFHQHMRDTGNVGADVAIWHKDGKATIMLKPTEPIPVHMDIGYREVPEKNGSELDTYGKRPTEDNESHAGKPVFSSVIRKKEEE